MLDIFLLRDDFDSLKCCLDLWLSSMLDCIHICDFLFLKNYFRAISIAVGHLLIARLSIEPLELPLLIVVITISIHRGF